MLKRKNVRKIRKNRKIVRQGHDEYGMREKSERERSYCGESRVGTRESSRAKNKKARPAGSAAWLTKRISRRNGRGISEMREKSGNLTGEVQDIQGDAYPPGGHR